MRLVKDIIKELQALDPDEPIYSNWFTKEDIQDQFSNQEHTDENDELIDTTSFVTNDVMREVSDSMENAEYLWERYWEHFNETCDDILRRILSEKEEAKEDTDLWDKEK